MCNFRVFPDKFEFIVKSKLAAILTAILHDVTDPSCFIAPAAS